MVLTYTDTIRRTETETVERTLTAPKEWGMYSPQGNNNMKKKAESLVKNLEKADSYSNKIKAFEKYYKAYNKACNSQSKVMAEAGDTEVRECVWFFSLKAGKAVGVNEGTLDDLWEQRF